MFHRIFEHAPPMPARRSALLNDIRHGAMKIRGELIQTLAPVGDG
jgi:hypothetical protein